MRRGPLGLTYLRDDGARTQVAFEASRRIGNAVVRNRSRRRVHALIIERASAGTLVPGAYLVHLGRALDRVPAAEVRAAVDVVFHALDERLAA